MKKALKKARQDCRYGANTYDFGVYTTNDLPGCPKGGLLKGTDKPDKLEGGLGSDILYGGDGDDTLDQWPSEGEDVIYGGDGNDWLSEPFKTHHVK
jgi:Ca2+-binding RTX toxin-like protein